MSDIIGITMGDPAGVGPEISVRALADMSPADRDRTLIYGNRATLEAAKALVGCDVDLDGRVVDLPVEGAPLPWGKLSPVAGDAAFRFIEAAVRDAQAGRIGCIVTSAASSGQPSQPSTMPITPASFTSPMPMPRG